MSKLKEMLKTSAEADKAKDVVAEEQPEAEGGE